MNKQEIRSKMRAMRAQLAAHEQMAATHAAAQRILALSAYASAKTVMAYIAVRGELDLSTVIKDVLDSGRRLVLPRCEKPGVMTARQVNALSELEHGTFGLLEPGADSEIVSPQEIDLILVPGTAFDMSGGRIGQGGGYYDRFLPQTKAVRVGVCHDFALFDHLDTEAHDARMDAVVTPGALFKP